MEASDPLADVDLNLFLVFEALMVERNVTRAATRLKRTQPAVSNALLRLRRRWSDPLFVRHARGVTPTARALQLAPFVRDALGRLREGLKPSEPFEPKTARHTFVIAASDHAQLLVLPSLSLRLATWPGVTLRVVPLASEFPALALERGELDLVLGVFDVAPGDRAPSGLKRQVLVDERMLAVARRGHPGLKRPLAQAMQLPQLNVSPRGGTRSRFDRRGSRPTRNIVLFVPHYLAAPWVLEKTDLLAVMPESIARRFARSFALEVAPLPGAPPKLKVQQLWHPSVHDQPAHQWLRAQLYDVARAGAEAG